MLKTSLLTIAVLASLALLALLALAATRPDHFRVERSVLIHAPAMKVFNLINDLREFNRWNPYTRKDAALRLDYAGPRSGPGASFAWDGNSDVGKGRLSITDQTPPQQVTMQLDMYAPMEGHNTVVFSVQPEADFVRVNWAMRGPAPYLSRLIGLIFNMDSMIGTDFETGLGSLKQLAEAGTS